MERQDGEAARRTREGISLPPFSRVSKNEEEGGKDMPKYVIERDIPGIGNATQEEARPYRRDPAVFSINSDRRSSGCTAT